MEPSLKDPVCGMPVTVRAPQALDYAGKTVHFCSAGCKTKFAANPSKYVVTQSASVSQVPETLAAVVVTVYTCPMHPDVRQDQPGACPKCGMPLEPLVPTVAEIENPELRDFRRR